jgi:hypothetical protein
MLDLNSIIAAIAAHNWLALVLIVAVYLRTLFSSKSAFPLTLPPNWQPVFVAFAGGVISTVGTIEAGKPVASALLAGVVGLITSGFLDGLVAAIFGSPANAPAWAKAIVMILDDVVEGGGGSGSGSSASSSGSSPAPTPTPGAPSVAARMLAFATACAALFIGCLQPKPATTQVADFTAAEACIQQHWGEPIERLAGDCVAGEIAAAEDLVADIEAIAEGGAIVGGSDPAKVRAAFPYADRARVVSKIDAKRDAFAQSRAVH